MNSVLVNSKSEGCILKIQSHLPTMNKKLRKVADFILKNGEEVVNLSITETAKQSKVSVATVSRFCNSLGYEKYQDFKIRLAQDLVLSLGNIHQEIQKEDDWVTVIRKVFQTNIQSLLDTEKIVDFESILKAVRAIEQAKWSNYNLYH